MSVKSEVAVERKYKCLHTSIRREHYITIRNNILLSSLNITALLDTNCTNSRQYKMAPEQRISKQNKSRHQVKHEYHDHALDDVESLISTKERRGPRGGVTTPFPVKLHNLLEDNLHADIISWQPHGRCFILRNPKEFLAEVMPKYFKQTKLTSFQRQLNLYGFNRLTSGPDKGGYYHELFLRTKEEICTTMVRMRIKGTRTKGASNPESEPNFYKMSPMPDSDAPNYNDDEISFHLKKETKYGYQASPVCVSTPGSSTPSSRSSSPMPDLNIGLPFVPELAIMARTSVMPRPSRCAPEVYTSLALQELPTDLLVDIPQFPDPVAEDDALLFEGKEFHYLESVSIPFMDDVISSFDTTDSGDFATLPIGTDGEMFGFDI